MAIELTDEMRSALANALSDKAPVIVSYADAEGQPNISFRGSVQVFSDTQLAFWARNPEGGITAALPNNPKLALLYRNPETRTAWQFFGTGAVTADEGDRTTIYDNSPEVERNADPDRKGLAVVVDISRVVQRGQVIMER